MRTFVLNDTEYTVQADGDTPPNWKINVFRDGIRTNDVPYVISQRECDLIQAATGRNPLDELARIAEADVVLGRNQLRRPIAAHEPNQLLGLRSFMAHEESVKRSAIDLICSCLRSSEAPEALSDERNAFAESCANRIVAGGSINFGSIQRDFQHFCNVG
jgi:hypothetical protein